MQPNDRTNISGKIKNSSRRMFIMAFWLGCASSKKPLFSLIFLGGLKCSPEVCLSRSFVPLYTLQKYFYYDLMEHLTP